MTTRKSTRIQNSLTQGPAEQTQTATIKAAAPKQKPKVLATKKISTQKGNGSKTKLAEATTARSKKPQNQATDMISSMPPELLKMTLDNVSNRTQSIGPPN